MQLYGRILNLLVRDVCPWTPLADSPLAHYRLPLRAPAGSANFRFPSAAYAFCCLSIDARLWMSSTMQIARVECGSGDITAVSSCRFTVGMGILIALQSHYRWNAATGLQHTAGMK